MPGQCNHVPETCDCMPKPETLEELMMKRGEAQSQKQVDDVIKKRLAELKAATERKPAGTSIDGPEHYNGYQVLEAICDAGLGRGFCLGNAVKYILRAEKKDNDEEDLKKAQFYLTWYLEHFYDNTGE